MASFGHAAFLGLGAYVVGLLAANQIYNGFVHLALLLVIAASVALLIGAVCLRSSGLAFIMLTLAFAQLLYFMGVSLKAYGGDDGFAFRGNTRFFDADLPFGPEITLYYVTWAVLAGALALIYRLVDSRFGLTLRGIMSNPRRMRSIGVPTFRYQLAAFVISGTMCAIAGALLANLTQFVSPSYMHWSRSGDLLIMAVLGGTASVFGPVLGTCLYMLLEELLSDFTTHWQIILGPLLILAITYGRNGISGLVAPAWSRGRQRA
jgi:branched-chain amino acid transport system permease protein